MPLTIHHLNKSQSERILFLVEELQLPYTLELHQRNLETALAPDSLKAVSPSGTAPVIIDDTPNPNNTRVVLAESGACVEYILWTYAPDSKLVKKPGHPGYPGYVNWLHYANGTLQPSLSRLMMLGRAGVDQSNPAFQFVQKKLDNGLSQIEETLNKTGAYLAGDDLTAADVMNVFTLTTMRGFHPLDLSAYPAILEYLQRVSKRDGYKRALSKGDPDLSPLLGAKVEKFSFGPQNK